MGRVGCRHRKHYRKKEVKREMGKKYGMRLRFCNHRREANIE